MRATLKKLLLLDMLYAFISAALAVMVPLYLVDLGIDIAAIGFIIAGMPLAIMISRIFFSSAADQIGTKSIEILESLATLFAIAIYALSRSAQAFAVAQFSEGVRDASFWATARVDVIHAAGKRHIDRAFAYLVGLRQLADGIGRVSVGVILLFFSFKMSFVFLFFLSLVMLVLILTINKNPFHRFPVSRLVVKRIFHRRPRHFWHHAFGVALHKVTPYVLLFFFLPLYLYTQLGFDYYATASVLAVFSLMIAVSNLLAVRMNLSMHAILFLLFLSVPALILLPLMGDEVLLPVIMISVGSGAGNLLTEKLICRETSGKKNPSTEISVLYFPAMLIQFLIMAIGGVFVSVFGFVPVFSFFAFVTLYYILYAQEVFRDPKKPK
ncbi:MFS transporter [Candidatus Micrarchaeota archaeon]|nr:MFS transporter [Candidatus Micrarchaeota archaeon]